MTNLNNEQARAVRHIDGPCLVLAGPGSGKTFTLVKRIENLVKTGVSPSSILVITFSKKAAVEMKTRYEKFVVDNSYTNVYFGTFHAVFYNILKQNSQFDKYSVITDRIRYSFIENVLKNIIKSSDKFKTDKYEKRINNSEYKMTLLNAIGLHKIGIDAKDIVKKPEFSIVFEDDEDIQLFERISCEYIKRCRENRKLDFEDMLYMCRDLLKDNISILEQYRNIYKYFLVDEFQDINEVQYEILKMLAGNRRNIFAVGDDDQSIYGFRGSDPSFMKMFIDENADIKIINLKMNYRSAECIVKSAEKLIVNNVSRIEKYQTAAGINKDNGSVNIEIFKNASEEADYTVKVISQIPNTESVAIIFRTNKCIHILNEKLKYNGFKCISSSCTAGYYDAEWIKDIITYIRLSVSSKEKELIYRIINRPDRGMTRDSDMSEILNKISFIKDMAPYAAVTYILKGIGYERYYYSMQKRIGTSEERAKELLKSLIDISRQYRTNREWLEAIGETSDNNDSKADELRINDKKEKRAVNLLTAHASKGLEFDNVFIVGLQEGIFPHRKALTEDQIEEERRLLYVAMTRARKKLYIIGRGEEKYGKRVSGFINELCGIMTRNEV